MTKLVKSQTEISLCFFSLLKNSQILQRQWAQEIPRLKENVFQSTKHILSLVVIICALFRLDLEGPLQSGHQIACLVDQETKPAEAGESPSQRVAMLEAGPQGCRMLPIIPLLLAHYSPSPSRSFIPWPKQVHLVGIAWNVLNVMCWVALKRVSF